VAAGGSIVPAMETDLEIDALGLLCPLPVLRLRKRIAALEPGSVVRLVADDPAAAIDVPHFCQQGGHAFLGAEPCGEGAQDGAAAATAYFIRKG